MTTWFQTEAAAGRPLAGGCWFRDPLLLALTGLYLGACSVNPKIELSDISAGSEPKIIESVPFYPQTEYQCGPAALAGVLGHSGIALTPEELSPQVYLPERQGSLQVELLAATRRAGRLPYLLEPEPDELVRELSAGRPVLVFQNLRTRHFPVWHYAVLVGFDAASNRFVINTGKRERERVSARKFLRTWDWSGRWAMIALPPGELPDSPDPLRYFQAADAFEAVAGATPARKAWQAAVRQWPADYRPHLALGNLAFKSADYSEAAIHYLRGLNADPGQPVLENNLAEALAAAGCARMARERLTTYLEGLEDDSPWRADLTQTLSG
ncbi:MAG: PA2778 family cysteine peptidase, partial [Xanthomonadales bacterium]|nr:PA2778 family cysteine peptidase [Xanthomonadales bacterium]